MRRISLILAALLCFFNFSFSDNNYIHNNDYKYVIYNDIVPDKALYVVVVNKNNLGEDTDSLTIEYIGYQKQTTTLTSKEKTISIRYMYRDKNGVMQKEAASISQLLSNSINKIYLSGNQSIKTPKSTATTKTPTATGKQNITTNSKTLKYRSTTPRSSTCGARTKKGGSCQRRVSGGGRCWQH